MLVPNGVHYRGVLLYMEQQVVHFSIGLVSFPLRTTLGLKRWLLYIYLHYYISPALFAYFLACHPYIFYIPNAFYFLVMISNVGVQILFIFLKRGVFG